MAVDAPRRSGRVRKPIKTYAEEQEEQATAAAPSMRKRKSTTPSVIEHDAQVGDEDFQATQPSTKRKGKTAKSAPTDDDDAKESTEPAPKKRKKGPTERAIATSSWHASAASTRIAREQAQVKTLARGAQEKRLRSYVDEPTDAHKKALKKVNSERMFILSRERDVEEHCHTHATDCPRERIQIAGSSGNVYNVTISHLPSCTCPVGVFSKKGSGKCCKHVLYILHHMLKAPEELLYQNAFLTAELRSLFANAPPLPAEAAEDAGDAEPEAMDGKRKPVEDDCPICCMEFEAGEDIVWCRAACGNNIHQGCFAQWERTKGGNVTCPFCRSAWEYEEANVGAGNGKAIKVKGVELKGQSKVGLGGYANVRHLLEYDE